MTTSGDFTLRLLDRLDELEGRLEEVEARLAEIKVDRATSDDQLPTREERAQIREKVSALVAGELEQRRTLLRDAKAGSLAAAVVLRSRYSLRVVPPPGG